MYMGNLKAGDRVKVIIEADVKHGSSFGVDLAVANGTVTIREESFPGVEFKKVAPLAKVFEPGDVVRNKATGAIVTLSQHGFVNHSSGRLHAYGGQWRPRHEFTSDKFERVNIS